MPTIHDVAKHADVSVTTVSRVLNNVSSVRPAIRRTVLQAIAELGYIPDETARGFRKSRSGAIGLLVPDLSHPVFQDFVEGIGGVVRDREYSLLLYDAHREEEVEAENIRRLLQRRVEGVILCPLGETCPGIELVARAGVPAVVITSSRQPFGLPKLFVDHDLGLQQAVRYLQGLGHKRIALVTRSSPRGVVFRADPAAMLRLGLPYEPALVVEAGSRQECLTVVPTMLDRADRPTALLLATHLYAPYVLGGIAAADLEIPNDISFITMGDSPWAQYYRPPLTVITFDRVAVGRMAAQYILTRLAGLDAEYLLTEIRSELVIRASCAPLER